MQQLDAALEREALALVEGFDSLASKFADYKPTVERIQQAFKAGKTVLGCTSFRKFCDEKLHRTPSTVYSMLRGGRPAAKRKKPVCDGHTLKETYHVLRLKRDVDCWTAGSFFSASFCVDCVSEATNLELEADFGCEITEKDFIKRALKSRRVNKRLKPEDVELVRVNATYKLTAISKAEDSKAEVQAVNEHAAQCVRGLFPSRAKKSGGAS
jgi:hypothetical protein